MERPYQPAVTRNRLLALAFCTTHCGKSLLWVGTDALSLYILIRIVEIPPILAGTLFILCAFWNAALDGLWGYMLDRLPAIRRVLPVLCGAAGALACLAFAMLPGLPSGSAWAAGAALILFRTAFALFDVPHNATAPLLADRNGHLQVARWRNMLSAAMTIIVGIAATAVMSAGAHNAERAAALFGALAFLALVLLAPLP